MEIKYLTLNPFQENTYIIYDKASHEAAIVDCGALFPEEEHRIDEFVKSNQLTVKHLINTHLHLDHCFGNHWAAMQYGIKPMAHEGDKPLLAQLEAQVRMFGLPIKVTAEPLGTCLADGDTLTLGNETIEVIHTPGHSPGGLCLYMPQSGILLSGDTLFLSSIGRSDLEGGSYSTLIRSIQTRLLTLPGETKVFCGHGDTTTIGYERENNPFL